MCICAYNHTDTNTSTLKHTPGFECIYVHAFVYVGISASVYFCPNTGRW